MSDATDPDQEIHEPKLERFAFTATRPVAVLMVFLSLMVLGAVSMWRLPVDLMPEMSYPNMTVRTEYPGAAPAEVENDVARPLEEVLGVVTGVTQISSISRAEVADIVLEFAWDSDMDKASQDVLEKLDTIRPTLPDEIKSPLILRYDPSLDPVLVYSIFGPPKKYAGIEGQLALRRVAEQQLKRWLEPIAGVAAVKIKGGLEEELQVDLDEDALRSTGIDIATVIGRLSASNVNLAGGSMLDGQTKYLVRTVNEFGRIEDIGALVVASVGGADVRLRDIAKITRGYKEREMISRTRGRESIEIEVYKEADANIVGMAQTVNAAIDRSYAKRLQEEFDVRIELNTDRSKFIESSIQEVRSTALTGGILAVVVLFLFLREARSTLIVSVAIPLSVLMTFAPLAWGGISLNIMSLGGLALGIGMLVDNSIVVLESIHRCSEEGDGLVRATLRGVSEVGTAVIASTLTSVAVFFPMVFVEGVAGQLFGDLGLTVVFSLLASLVVALFFIPMLASRTMPPAQELVSEQSIFVSRWTSWQAVREFRASLGQAQQSPALWLLLPYVLLRLLLSLVFELLGKIITSVFSLVAGALVLVVVAISKVFGVLSAPIVRAFDALLLWISRFYRALLQRVLGRARSVVIGIFAVILGLGAFLGAPETELIPELHQGELAVEVSFPVGTPLQKTDRSIAQIEKLLLQKIPNLRSLSTTVGSERDSLDADDRGEHTAKFVIALAAGGGQAKLLEYQKKQEQSRRERAAKTKAAKSQDGDLQASDASDASDTPGASDRKDPGAEAESVEKSALAVDVAQAEERAIAVIRSELQKLTDLSFTISRPVLFSFKKPVEVQVFAHDLRQLSEATQKISTLMSGLPGIRDVQPSIRAGNPEIQIRYDRDALARLNLDIRKVAELVRDKVLGREASKFNRADRKVPIRVRLDREFASNQQQLSALVVNPGENHPIPLGAVAELVRDRSPNEIRRLGQQRVGLIEANLEGMALGTAALMLDKALEPMRQIPGLRVVVSGQQEEWDTSARSLYIALGLSIFLVYVIMASQFESLIHPLIILVTIPLGLVGVMLALSVLRIPLSIVVGLGVIMLVGIVVNNAIVLIDYINQLRLRGLPLKEAVVEAGMARLRPILMTTATTVLGLLPMALGVGDGSEIRQPMAVTVIAGLSASTLLTLIVIPTLYCVIESLRRERRPQPASEQLEAELRQWRAGAAKPQAESKEGPDV